MVPVVLVDGQQGAEGLELLAADALLGQLLGVVRRQGGGGAHAVVDHPHLHPGGGLFRQNVQHVRPHGALGDDEVLQEDIFLGLGQFPEKDGEKVRPGGVVGGLRVAVGGAQGGVLQVPGLLHGVRPVVEEVGGGQLGHQVVLHGPAGLCPAVVGLAAAP